MKKQFCNNSGVDVFTREFFYIVRLEFFNCTNLFPGKTKDEGKEELPNEKRLNIFNYQQNYYLIFLLQTN